MEISVLKEAGYEEALLGLSLSYNRPIEEMVSVASRLCGMDDGHNKFLESVVVWLDINAPRYWWQQFDTYRVGVTKQSESTMHTLTKKEVCAENFEGEVGQWTIDKLNKFIKNGNLVAAKRLLPESFLQRRIVCLNYKVIRHIIRQRKTHKLKEWVGFCEFIPVVVSHPEFLE